MKKINESLIEILHRLNESGLFWFTVFICIIVLFVLLWLITRRPRLWYWKVGTQTDALTSIERKMQQLEEGLKNNTVPVIAPELIEQEKDAAAEIKEEEEDVAASCKGKSGKIYTEQELEELIRD